MGRKAYSDRKCVENTYRLDLAVLKRLNIISYYKKTIDDEGYFYRNQSIHWRDHNGEYSFSANIKIEHLPLERSIYEMYKPLPYAGPAKFIEIEHRSFEQNKIKYKIFLTTTPCKYTGFRYWFLCPNTKCQKRVRVLYKLHYKFFCRSCMNLTYRSRRKNRKGKFSAYEAAFSQNKKEEEISSTIKRWYYAGKPTKQYLKLRALSDVNNPYTEKEDIWKAEEYQKKKEQLSI